MPTGNLEPKAKEEEDDEGFQTAEEESEEAAAVADDELKAPPEAADADAADDTPPPPAPEEEDGRPRDDGGGDDGEPESEDESKLAAAAESGPAKAGSAATEPSCKCSCVRTQCLKMYCECLREGQYCNDDCVCRNCRNTKEHDGEGGIRLEAVRYILAKKPDALTEELRAMAREGGWEPPAKPKGIKSPFVKSISKKKGKKLPARSASKGAKGVKRKHSDVPADDDDDESYEDEFGEDGAAVPLEDEFVAAPGAAIPFATAEFPLLAIDPSEDHSSLASSFTGPLFDRPSRALEIAYSQRSAFAKERRKALKRRDAVSAEYDVVRERYLRKRAQLAGLDRRLGRCDRRTGAWTRKVFDLELEESPSAWNDNYKRLKAYKEEHGRLPPNAKKAKDEEERSLSTWLDRVRTQKSTEAKEEDPDQTPTRNKSNRNKKFVKDYPHRLERLAELGVVWESRHENRWETMFQRLVAYREEMGTLRFPTDEQCAATGDEELIALQKWAKGQVLKVRYGKKKNMEAVRRLREIGFDFEKWYAKPGKAKRAKAEENDNEDDAVVGAKSEEDVADGEGQQQIVDGADEDAVMMEAKMPVKEGVGGGDDVEMQLHYQV